jgi:hypothetical protein
MAGKALNASGTCLVSLIIPLRLPRLSSFNNRLRSKSIRQYTCIPLSLQASYLGPIVPPGKVRRFWV